MMNDNNMKNIVKNRMLKPLPQIIRKLNDQSIRQSTDQSIRQSTDQSIGESKNKSREQKSREQQSRKQSPKEASEKSIHESEQKFEFKIENLVNQIVETLKSADYDKPRDAIIEEAALPDNTIIYALGDLEGKIDLVYDFLLSKNLVEFNADSTLKWSGGNNVYVVQCGDQLDSRPREGNYQMYDNQNSFDIDMGLFLFMEFLYHLSDKHVISILGNHELGNIINYNTTLTQYVHSKDRVIQIQDMIVPRKDFINFENCNIFLNIFKNRFVFFKMGKCIFSHAGPTKYHMNFLKLLEGTELYDDTFYLSFNNYKYDKHLNCNIEINKFINEYNNIFRIHVPTWFFLTETFFPDIYKIIYNKLNLRIKSILQRKNNGEDIPSKIKINYSKFLHNLILNLVWHREYSLTNKDNNYLDIYGDNPIFPDNEYILVIGHNNVDNILHLQYNNGKSIKPTSEIIDFKNKNVLYTDVNRSYNSNYEEDIDVRKKIRFLKINFNQTYIVESLQIDSNNIVVLNIPYKNIKNQLKNLFRYHILYKFFNSEYIKQKQFELKKQEAEERLKQEAEERQKQEAEERRKSKLMYRFTEKLKSLFIRRQNGGKQSKYIYFINDKDKKIRKKLYIIDGKDKVMDGKSSKNKPKYVTINTYMRKHHLKSVQNVSLSTKRKKK